MEDQMPYNASAANYQRHARVRFIAMGGHVIAEQYATPPNGKILSADELAERARQAYPNMKTYTGVPFVPPRRLLSTDEAQALLNNPLINFSAVAAAFYADGRPRPDQALRERMAVVPPTPETLERLSIIFETLLP